MKIYKVYDNPIFIKKEDIEWFKKAPSNKIKAMVVKFLKDNENDGWLIPRNRIKKFIEQIKELRNGTDTLDRKG